MDTNMLKRYQSDSSTEIDFYGADINADGVIDPRDSNLLKRTFTGN